MNRVHESIVSRLRDILKEKPSESFPPELTDLEFAHRLFANFRGRDDTKGFRLTYPGWKLMQQNYRPYEVEREGDKLKAKELVYLDRAARLPYYVDTKGRVFMFDPDLTIRLKLADGDIGILVEMDEILNN